MRMLSILVTTASLATLPACATVRDVFEDPVVVQASPTAITYRFSEGLMDDAKKAADKYCRNHGRTAQLERVTPGEGNDRTAVFNCV